jgi:hypothetical protein
MWKAGATYIIATASPIGQRVNIFARSHFFQTRGEELDFHVESNGLFPINSATFPARRVAV